VTKGIDTMPPLRLLSLPEVADRLGCSIKTLRRRIATGDLAIIRDGRLIRVRPEDLERYIQQRRYG
jgi:excisionase family DNA binding protein